MRGRRAVERRGWRQSSLRALPTCRAGCRRPLRAIVVIALGHLLEAGRAALWAARLAVDLRTNLWRLAGGERIEDRAHALLGQILVIVVVDLDHRRVGAGAETFDLGQREQPVVGRLALLQAAALAGGEDIVRSGQHARRRAADLDVEFADGGHV